MKKIKQWIAPSIILVLVVFGMSLDYEDKINEHKIYCEDVSEKVYPDYKGIYDKLCVN